MRSHGRGQHPAVSDGVVAEFLEGLARRTGCVLERGLTEDELSSVESELSLRIAAPWRAVLSRAHPRPGGGPSRSFPDWRLRDVARTQEIIDQPIEGILFDVEHNGFWWRDWGERPEGLPARIATARRALATVPRLTPLWGHWYAAPGSDSPVFSIVQTDLWIPAVSLAALIEGRPQSEDELPAHEYPVGSVPFWSLLHAWSQIGHLDEELVRLAGGDA